MKNYFTILFFAFISEVISVSLLMIALIFKTSILEYFIGGFFYAGVIMLLYTMTFGFLIPIFIDLYKMSRTEDTK